MTMVHGFLALIQAVYYLLQPPMDSENTLEPVNITHLLERYKPQLVVETSGKTPRIPKVSSFKKPALLHSDSEASDQESLTHYELLPPLSASPTQSSPLRTLKTPSPQQGSTTAGHRPSTSPSSQTNQMTSSTSTTLSLSSSSPESSSSESSSSTSTSTTPSLSSSSPAKSSSSESSSSTSTSSTSSSCTCRMDEQGDAPPVSRDNTPNSNLMDIDHLPLDNTEWSEDNFLGRDQLQEDKEDDDGVPVSRIYHPLLDGTPCDKYGNDLPKGMPPPPSDGDSVLPPQGDWTPYNDRKEFETADLLFTYQQMSAGNMNKLFNIWEASLVPFDAPPPFTNADDMYEIIDSTPYGDLRWQSFTIRYNLHNDPPSTKAPTAWKTAEYDGWFRDPCKLIRNMLANRGFDKEFDYVPYQEYDYKGQHRFH
ncbi:hypothetical protein V8E52_010864, partial [Russula decolorans]